MASEPRHCTSAIRQNDRPIAALDLDTAEHAVLTAARFFFLSFAEPAGQAWLSVILASDSIFDGPQHAETMRRTCALVHEVRCSRRSTLRFSNPNCAHCAAIVTEHERHFIQMVQAVRTGNLGAARTSAMLLCEGNNDTRVLRAAHEMTGLFKARPRHCISGKSECHDNPIGG